MTTPMVTNQPTSLQALHAAGLHPAPAPITQPQLLTYMQVAHWLGIPRSTAHLYMQQGKFGKVVRIGKHPRLRRADVEAFIARGGDEQ